MVWQSRLNDRIKLPLEFDAARLQEEVLNLAVSDWVDHFVPDNYEGRWSIAPLRAPSTAEHPIMMIYSDPSCTDFSDTAILQRSPYLQAVLATFSCDLNSVRLMSLAAGSRIREHRDHSLSVEHGTVRLHVPITTNAKVRFMLNNQQVLMNPGECWYLRLADPHHVVNSGVTDRVHLVIDARVNDWLLNLLAS